MRIYAIYDNETGRIKRQICCSPSAVEGQAKDKEGILCVGEECLASEVAFRVRNGVLEKVADYVEIIRPLVSRRLPMTNLETMNLQTQVRLLTERVDYMMKELDEIKKKNGKELRVPQ